MNITKIACALSIGAMIAFAGCGDSSTTTTSDDQDLQQAMSELQKAADELNAELEKAGKDLEAELDKASKDLEAAAAQLEGLGL